MRRDGTCVHADAYEDLFWLEPGDAAVFAAPEAEELGDAEWTGLWTRSPLSSHQAGRAAKVSANCQAGNG